MLLFLSVLVHAVLPIAVQLPERANESDILKEDLGSFLEPFRIQRHVPALAAAVVQGGVIVASGVTGFRVAGEEVPVEIDDKFNIGSCTKSMTATIAGTLLQKEKISWDLTLSESFPLLVDKMNDAYQEVTLQQLLSHLSGMPRDATAIEMPPSDSLWTRIWKREVAQESPRAQRRFLVETVIVRDPEVAPGDTFLYSNLGVATAGAMLEQVTDKSWESLMDIYLFEPLGMATAGFGYPASPRTFCQTAQRNQPWGHTRNLGKLTPVEPGPPGSYNPPAYGPAGTVHCSIEDFAKYARFHVRGANGKEPSLSLDIFKTLHVPEEGQDYALGWMVTERQWGGGDVIMHNGSNGMFFSVMWLAPLKNFAVVVACNAGGEMSAKACDEVAGALINKYLP